MASKTVYATRARKPVNWYQIPDIVTSCFLLLACILAITFFCRVIINHAFGVVLEPQYWHRDYLGNLVVALIIALLVQSIRKTLLLASVVIVMFQLSNALKLVVLGTPASPDDFFNIQNIFFLTDGWRRVALFFLASLPLVLTIALIPWKRASAWLALLVLTIAAYCVVAQSEPLRIALDTHIGNSVWNQPANYRQRGLALHLAQETVRTISKVDKPPTSDAVNMALNTLMGTSSDKQTNDSQTFELNSASGAIPTRNVHVFVLESFFDPLQLGEQWVPEDPLPADFRELWAATDNSTALSPVFGGYTANAEFEMLCGFPVTRNAVFFEGWLRKPAPCLPRIMNQLGYRTVASHPNVPGFWNRTNAYQLIGFDEYISKTHFDLTDSVDTLLMDHSMYEQVFKYLDEARVSAPVFNYMLTYHGHLPYPSSENYPDKISAGKGSALLHGYLNQIWYKSRALMQQLNLLRQKDPDALIVIFGDHLPFLGPNYGVYTEAWNLPSDRSDFSGTHLEKLTSPPLIVIDGERGPLKLGKLPLYRLPSLITSLLGQPSKFLFDATKNPVAQRVRPVYGMHYTLSENTAVACTENTTENEPCKTSNAWLDQVKVLIGDIFTGKQYSLE